MYYVTFFMLLVVLGLKVCLLLVLKFSRLPNWKRMPSTNWPVLFALSLVDCNLSVQLNDFFCSLTQKSVKSMLQTETADDTEKTQAPDVGGSEVARQLAEAHQKTHDFEAARGLAASQLATI